VLVKRAIVPFGQMAKQTGKPIAWDALDFWQQPAQNQLNSAQAVTLARTYIDAVRPTLVIGATEAMAQALDGVYLPHHTWRGLEPMASRPEMGIVAYQGNPLYLGRWFVELQRACAARGWRFVVNPDQLWQADLIVALRDGPWDGWICREWKSGVKLANAIAAGRPVLTQDTAAMRELRRQARVIEDASLISTPPWTIGRIQRPDRTRMTSVAAAPKPCACRPSRNSTGRSWPRWESPHDVRLRLPAGHQGVRDADHGTGAAADADRVREAPHSHALECRGRVD
jgi:hypothetical protein